jgi:hypothetical protein
MRGILLSTLAVFVMNQMESCVRHDDDDDDDDDMVDAGPPPPPCMGPPGLYQDGSCEELAEGVEPYEPLYELWSDGAEKDRFIYLPPGTTIDTTNPDRWNFPRGTRIYKTFALDGVRIETRLLEKTGDLPAVTSWTLVSYQWSADQTSVTLAPAAGVVDALGTTHDIPSQAQCRSCHTMPNLDVPNGFGAIQLNHHRRGSLTLHDLLRDDLLVNVANPAEPNVTRENSRIPGNRRDRRGMGYLHANCGHCHGGPTPRAGLSMWSVVGAEELEDTPTFQTGICNCLTRWTGRTTAEGEPIEMRIAPGDADRSGIIGRMSVRGGRDQMPPLGTEFVHEVGLEGVREWIDGLHVCCDESVVCTPPAM